MGQVEGGQEVVDDWLRQLPLGYVVRGLGQFLVALRSNNSLDLTLFVDGLPVLVRRCVGPQP